MQARRVYENQELEWVKCNYCTSTVTKTIYDFSPLAIVKCKTCGVVYTNPRLTLRAIEERLYNGEYWEAYEIVLDSAAPAVQQFNKKWLNRLANYSERGRWKICEIGPGLGAFLAEAKTRGHEVYGVELSEYAIDYARTRFGVSTVFEGTADKIDTLGLPKMDVIVMLATIEHLQDPLGVLGKVNACLSEGGLLMLSTGVWGCFNQIVAGKAWKLIDPEGHLYYFSKQAMRMFMDRAKFRVLKLETNSTLINPLTKNKFLVKVFNNSLTGMLRVSSIAGKLGLGDEMFIVAQKVG
jgi:SAM-dependent methyltransferase